MKKFLDKLLSNESSSGVLLMLAAVFALIFKNVGGLSEFYDWFVHLQITMGIGDFKLDESLHFWVNDALMVLFFFIVGLDLKSEMVEGQLSKISQVILPCIAALGGVVLPAVIFVIINWGDPVAMKGWAIPTATDIAFAVGVLALLGKKVPTSLKIFVLTLAIIDDLCAILIIALFYSSSLNLLYLLLAAVVLGAMIALNKKKIFNKTPYVILSLILWVLILNSGIHATIAGVVAAFTIPLHTTPGNSMLHDMERALVTPVNFIILPLFAFVNAGVSLKGLDAGHLFGTVPMGIFFGLFFGKQIGIFLFSWIIVKLKIASLPENANWAQLYAVGIICGIGFTMSLFVDGLAYGEASIELYKGTDKLAILMASLISGIVGFVVAKIVGRRKLAREAE
ncbi:sodium:proton antiporter [Campylobacter blaseri]|uniref:Na(+)/H(+) antiporter NhaA n=1 Tax=Campylobacter blaseri TaxID=2042961 RepID=A0A2P8R3C3_9BACT|nr:Na+/H+ antiporter NhaA [Campylobacter blaseri]PSM52991.1 Na+/H+ antiporter NhaA [Campylobacter blaseri]PSM54458.1 Na+/H+ antiporter NhaA [Campylobacter blaseri]QKF85298.1 sodium:proton antiporter [Campylobacter blaseri]